MMLVLAVPVIGFSEGVSMLLGYELPDAGWVGWVSPLLGIVVYVWGGRPFLIGAVGELRALTCSTQLTGSRQ
jgi:P-type Cu2+ transporter